MGTGESNAESLWGAACACATRRPDLVCFEKLSHACVPPDLVCVY